MMRVIPVDAGVGKVHAIRERAARGHERLRDAGHAVESIVESHAVPVHCARLIERVVKAHDDRRALVHPNERPGILPIEAIHRERLSRRWCA